MQVKVDELWWLVKKIKIVNTFFVFNIFFLFLIFFFNFFSLESPRFWEGLKKNVCEYLFVKKPRPANPRLRGPQISGRGRK